MKHHGMLFKGIMVNKLLDEVAPKTQTRRPITFHNSVTVPKVTKKQWPELDWSGAVLGYDREHEHNYWRVPFRGSYVNVLPRIKPGDIIWVKEKWAVSIRGDEDNGYIEGIEYSADGAFIGKDISSIKNVDNYMWRSSMLMPRWASRIDLLVLKMRTQRVQDISESDAQAEGWTKLPEMSDDSQVHCDAARDWFMDLWDSINSDRGFGWASNHPVWIHDLERVKP